MDWAYMLLERFVIQGIRASRDRSYPEADRLEVLRSALESGSDVRMVYFAASSRQFTERVVTPLRLSQAQGGQWVLRGFDHLRGEERTFRVTRMKEVGAVERLPGLPEPPDKSLGLIPR